MNRCSSCRWPLRFYAMGNVSIMVGGQPTRTQVAWRECSNPWCATPFTATTMTGDARLVTAQIDHRSIQSYIQAGDWLR